MQEPSNSFFEANSLVRTPLYQQVASMIRSKYVSGKASGVKLPPERQLSSEFNVSMGTIRSALQELEIGGSIERNVGSGTFVRDLLSNEQRHVAVLLDVDIASGNVAPYFTKISREIRRALTELGITSRFYVGDLPLGTEALGLTCDDFLKDVHLDRVKGLISFFTKRNSAWVDLLEKKNIPIIDPEFAQKNSSDLHFIHSALSFLKERGRRQIAAVLWESQTDGINVFSKTLMMLAPEYGMRVETRWLDITANGWERGMGWERVRDIWRSGVEKPDGLIIADDMLFADCQRAIQDLGISVPDALDVVVRSTDAIDLQIELPVCNWKMLTVPAALSYAMTMKAMLEGQRPSSFPEAIYEVHLAETESIKGPDEVPAQSILKQNSLL